MQSSVIVERFIFKLTYITLFTSSELHLGNVLLEHVRYEEAINRYDRALRIQRDCGEAWNNRGVALVMLNRYREALNSYDQALRIQRNCCEAWNNRGYSLVELRDYTEAIYSYKQALKIRRNYHAAWHNLGNVYMILNQRGAAFFCYCQALRFHPGWTQLRNALRSLSHHSGKAITSFVGYSDKVITGLGDYAIAIFSHCIHLICQPDYYAACNKLGMGLSRLTHSSGNAIKGCVGYSDKVITGLGDYTIKLFSSCINLIRHANYHAAWDKIGIAFRALIHPSGNERASVHRSEAIVQYQEFLKIEPNNHEILHKLGNALMILGRYKEAIDSYDKAVTITPNDYEAHYNCGLALLQLGRDAEALESFDLSLKIKPDDYKVQHSRDIALKNLEDYKGLIERYDQAIKFKPNDYQFHYNRGNTLWNLGRYLEAIVSFEQALKINLRYHQAWCERGLALYEIGRYEMAIYNFGRAFAINPSYHEAWYGQGLALYSIGRYKEAIDSFDQCLQLEPKNHNALNAKGMALYQLVRYEEAIDSFKKALKLENNSYEIWYNLGNVLKDVGRYQEAVDSYNYALHLTQDQFWSAWNERGWAIFKLWGYKAALENWNTGLKKLRSSNLEFNVMLKVLLYYSYSERISLILSLAILLYRTQVNNVIALEGWGVLHHSVGRAHYQYGRQQKNQKYYWKKAKVSYQYALEFLTADKFCQRRLNLLKDLIPLCRDLGNVKEVEALSFDGRDLLARLIKKTPSIGKQYQLRMEFLDFARLRIDQLVQSPKAEDWIEALNLAETHKNLCLRYCLYGWSDTNIDSLNYSDFQGLLNPKTALIYWHISPAAITTFILRFQKPLLIWKYSQVQNVWRHFLQPLSTFLSLFAKKAKLKSFVYPPNTRQLQDFEAWVQEWKKQYQRYRYIREADHPWRKDMEQELKKLGQILNISAITRELKDVSQLILIPHRDLHLLPVDAVFPDHFTISYLPSAQVGIQLQQARANLGRWLLSVENPRNDLRYANIEASVIREWFYPDSPPSIRGKQATRTQVITALQTGEQLGVFHFTGHGQHNINHSLESALLLADQDKLTLRDILQPEFNIKLKTLIYRFPTERISLLLLFIYFLHRDQTLSLDLSRFRLVCLSACETGITGQEDLINEFVGLVSGFLSAGATNVVSSLWLVDDVPTTFLMIKFYQNMQNGDSIEFALNKAKKWLRSATRKELEDFTAPLNLTATQEDLLYDFFQEMDLKEATSKDKDNPFNSPFYWAAFCTVGQ